ncbi:MAG TPA: hypothetical protein VE944_26620 [Nostoc sp.]|uniref:hypothetical protein n=1 Tax=Nostoc sp. TaxID=1180 RepID=UPI002D5A57CA|nr:hypothetical protein [Nostoc sp.]HYX17869.1 hypothetical protein [Nostoc sp.]
MRVDLKNTGSNKRYRFVALIGRTGNKADWKHSKDTVLLLNVRLESESKILADHLWMNKSKAFNSINEGDKITFEARVCIYTSASKIDYSLSYPTKVKKIESENREALKKFQVITENTGYVVRQKGLVFSLHRLSRTENPKMMYVTDFEGEQDLINLIKNNT